MPKRLVSFMLALVVLGSLGLFSCGKDDDDSWAPENIVARAFAATVTGGTAPLGHTGTFTMYFGVNNHYDIDGDDVNIIDSEGTYDYERMSDDTGEITLSDGTLGIMIRIVLTYSAEGRGAYAAEVLDLEVGGNQTGTFVEVEE